MFGILPILIHIHTLSFAFSLIDLHLHYITRATSIPVRIHVMLENLRYSKYVYYV